MVQYLQSWYKETALVLIALLFFTPHKRHRKKSENIHLILSEMLEESMKHHTEQNIFLQFLQHSVQHPRLYIIKGLEMDVHMLLCIFHFQLIDLDFQNVLCEVSS